MVVDTMRQAFTVERDLDFFHYAEFGEPKNDLITYSSFADQRSVRVWQRVLV
jgi:hypothetical protein